MSISFERGVAIAGLDGPLNARPSSPGELLEQITVEREKREASKVWKALANAQCHRRLAGRHAANTVGPFDTKPV
jgi:hypothetical protein